MGSENLGRLGWKQRRKQRSESLSPNRTVELSEEATPATEAAGVLAMRSNKLFAVIWSWRISGFFRSSMIQVYASPIFWIFTVSYWIG